MGLSDLWLILREWGPIAGPTLIALIFFLWKDWRREDHLQSRIEKLEQEQKEVLMPMLKECVSVIARNTQVMSRIGKVLSRCRQFQNKNARQLFDQLIADSGTEPCHGDQV
jgi:hypothetical protein